MSGEANIVGRVLVEITRRYFVIKRCDHVGKVLDVDAFRYPFDLTRQEARQEAAEAYGVLFDYANDTINGATDVSE